MYLKHWSVPMRGKYREAKAGSACEPMANMKGLFDH